MKNLVKYLNMGIIIALCLIFGVGIGHLADKLFHLEVVGKFIGLIVGTIFGFIYLWKLSKNE